MKAFLSSLEVKDMRVDWKFEKLKDLANLE